MKIYQRSYDSLEVMASWVLIEKWVASGTLGVSMVTLSVPMSVEWTRGPPNTLGIPENTLGVLGAEGKT